MPNGYYGKIVRVNLTIGEIKKEALSEEMCRMFLGGSGISAKIIADEVSANADPLGPDNKIVFATGPINMVNIPGSGRWEACAISPQTKKWGEANAGGWFGRKLKKTGNDVLILEGKADYPVIIVLTDEELKILDAKKYWGKDSIESAKELAEDFGKEYSILTIGQAGERLVPIACILSEAAEGHAGRTGMGAVMGSKNVKAILVNGNQKSQVADEEKVKSLIRQVRKNILNSGFYPDFHKHGQAGAIVPREAESLLPMKNWLIGSWADGARKIGAPIYTDELNVKKRGCAYCPVTCKRFVTVKDGTPYDHEGPGAEYETLGMIGSNLLIDNLKKISYANDLCNRYGIDTISVGGIIAMVFELYEKSVIDSTFLDGIEAKWGDADAMVELIKKIGLGEGIGKELGKGVVRLKEIFGEKANAAGAEVMGLEVPAHDPRAYYSMAVTYATSTRGACHMHGFSEAMEMGVTIPEIGVHETVHRFSEEKKGHAAAVFADLLAIHNSMVWCAVLPSADIPYPMQVDIINAITGWEIGYADFIKIGERINTLQHLLNLKRGHTRKDMRLPERFQNPLKEGGAAGQVPDFDRMLNDFLSHRGWDKQAIPSKEKLKELQLLQYI